MKKTVLIIFCIILLLFVFVELLFFKPIPSFVLLSADKIYIESTDQTRVVNGELKNAYWVVTFTVDVFQSHYFLLDDKFSSVKQVDNSLNGVRYAPTSVINISFIPLEPYYIITGQYRPIKIIPEIYDCINSQPDYITSMPEPQNRHPPFIADLVVFQLGVTYTEIYQVVPFIIEIRKNGQKIAEKIVAAVGKEAEYIVGEDLPEGAIRLDVVGILSSGIKIDFVQDFVYFGENKFLRLNNKDGRNIIDNFLQYKETETSSSKEFPNGAKVPDYEAMNWETYFNYWVNNGKFPNAWGTPLGNDINTYSTFQWNCYWFCPITEANPAVGTNRPIIRSKDVAGYSVWYVDEAFCDAHPGWTKTDFREFKWGLTTLSCYRSALYNEPNLIFDNPNGGKSVYNWLVQDKGAITVDLLGTYGKRIEVDGNTLRVYYEIGTLGWDVVSLRIPTDLADTYAYGEYETDFDILDELSYWQDTGTLDNPNIVGGVKTNIVVTVKNTGTQTANAQLKAKAISPTNLFDFLVLPVNIISNNTIAPQDTYKFTFSVINKGTTSDVQFSFEISVWSEAKKCDTIVFTGTLKATNAILTIYTVGDNGKAKIYINGRETVRNRGSYYQAIVPAGLYKVSFEELEGYYFPKVYLNNIYKGLREVTFNVEVGMSYVVSAIYTSADVKLIAEFSTWSEKGFLGLSPTYNVLKESRPTLPQWYVVRLSVKVTAPYNPFEGKVRIVIYADESGGIYYAEKLFDVALGSGSSKILDVDFMLGNAKGYYFKVYVGEVTIYEDSNEDVRPEVFVSPWFIGYLPYISIGGLSFTVGVLAIYLKRKREYGGVRY